MTGPAASNDLVRGHGLTGPAADNDLARAHGLTGPAADNDLVHAPRREHSAADRRDQAPTGDLTRSGAARSPSTPRFGSVAADFAAGDESSRRPGLLRSFVAAVAGAGSAASAVLLVRNGIHTDEFPPFLQGATATPITRYSGPWLTAGAGAALLAALLLLSAAIGVIRWTAHRRQQRRLVPAVAGDAGAHSDVIGPTSL